MDYECRSPRPLFYKNNKLTISQSNNKRLKFLEIAANYPDLYSKICLIIKEFNKNLTNQNTNALYDTLVQTISSKQLCIEIMKILVDNELFFEKLKILTYF